MKDTGERMVPEESGETTFWEHIYRYKFATKYVLKKDVLDVACGEGYGTRALMEAGAKSVVGVDVSADAVSHAVRKYGINARRGDASALPLGDGSVDVVVSFETIEHVVRPEHFIAECSRVLRPSGMLVISTPNKSVYGAGHVNPFHCSEMSEPEFVSLLTQRFPSVRFYSQVLKDVRWWSLRSLATPSKAWHKVRGYWRVAKALCPPVHQMDMTEFRMRPVAAILSRENPLASLVNPYHVRRRSKWSGEVPCYLIAVATKSEKGWRRDRRL